MGGDPGKSIITLLKGCKITHHDWVINHKHPRYPETNISESKVVPLSCFDMDNFNGHQLMGPGMHELFPHFLFLYMIYHVYLRINSFSVNPMDAIGDYPGNAYNQDSPIKNLALIPMLINSDQCRLMPKLINIGINARILIGIDWHWSALGIDRGSPAITFM